MALPENCSNGFFLFDRIDNCLNWCLCIAKLNQQQLCEAANGYKLPLLGSGRYLCNVAANLQKSFVLICLGTSFVKESAAALQVLCQGS